MTGGKSGFSIIKLISLIIAITVLVLTSAFAIMMFMLSDSISNDSKNLDRAVLEATGAVERFKTAGMALHQSEWAQGAQITAAERSLEIIIHYDANWNRLPSEEGRAFSLHFSAFDTGRTISGQMGSTNISVGDMFDVGVVVKSYGKKVFKPETEDEIFHLNTTCFKKD